MHSQVSKNDSGGSSAFTGNGDTITTCSDFVHPVWSYQWLNDKEI